MSGGLRFYLFAWLTFCTIAFAVAVVKRKELSFLRPAYWKFLGKPWRLLAFALSGGCITLIGPYTTDPTWDWRDGLVMSVLTFFFAPWSLGTLYRYRKETPAALFVAVVVSLFSFAWSYDGYILLRDGGYPETWASNIPLSGAIYSAAGIFWSLTFAPGRGVFLAFQGENWPPASEGAVLRHVWVYLLPIAVLMCALVGAFVRY
jgi:hypothetical protein